MTKTKKKISRQTRSNIITYGIVILAYIIVQTMINTGSISMAAKNLYISQPALSQCVKKVEQE